MTQPDYQPEISTPLGVLSQTYWIPPARLRSSRPCFGVLSLTIPPLLQLQPKCWLSNNRAMDQMRTTIELALRVLTAISVKKNRPERRDVEELRELAPVRLAKEPTEELACGVIQEAIKKHRAKTASGE